MTVSIPYSLVPGSKAKAEEVNANFVALKNGIDTLDSNKANIDFSNLTATDIERVKEAIGVTYKNIGEIVYSTVPLIDSGLHLLDGALISSGVYAGFVNYIKNIYENETAPNIFCSEQAWQSSVNNYGECGKFVYDSENETVRLPKIDGIFQGTTDLSALDSLIEAGLPPITHTHTRGSMNITGTVDGFKCITDMSTRTDGALKFQALSATGGIYQAAAGKTQGKLTLTASNNWTGATSDNSSVNSIYGNSLTVQPQTIKCLVYIVVANSTKTEVQSDIDAITTDLNSKADIDGTNMAQSVKNFDGTWIGSYYEIASSVTLTDSTNNYNLSSYLPNDEYCYEVIGSVHGNTGTSSGDNVDIHIGTSVIDGTYRVACAKTRSSSSVSWAGCFFVVVGANRLISLGNFTSYPANVNNFRVFAYRRVGTNK